MMSFDFCLGHDNTVLNEMGKQQVELVGNRFKYEHLTRIYSSDLERAFKASVLTYWCQKSARHVYDVLVLGNQLKVQIVS